MNEEAGLFCEAFGDTPRNRMLEFFLEMRNTDYGIADVARILGMNKATAYIASKDLISKKILIPARLIGRTKTFKLNKESPSVKAMIKAFDSILKSALIKQEVIS